MQGVSGLTGAEFVRRNIKRLLEHWGAFTVTLSVIGAGIGVLTLYIFTSAIGRVDLFMMAIDAKSALAVWVLIVVLIGTFYLASLSMTTWFYGMAVSLFENIPDKLGMVALWLLLPIWVGFGAFIMLVFYGSNYFRVDVSLVLVCVVTASVYGLLFLGKGFRKLFRDSSAGMGRAKRFFALAFQCFIVCFTVVLSAIPASIILKSYVGEDGSDAVGFVAVLTFFTLALSLVPAFVFYASKGEAYMRAIYGSIVALLLLSLFFLFSRGAMSTVTYAAARSLQVKQDVPARFVLADDVSLSDFDNLQWRTRLHGGKRVEVQGFSLFSFGDVLLLCPGDYINLGLHDLSKFSMNCFLTQNSKVVRMPQRPSYGSGRVVVSDSWEAYASDLVNKASILFLIRRSDSCRGDSLDSGLKLLTNTSCGGHL